MSEIELSSGLRLSVAITAFAHVSWAENARMFLAMEPRSTKAELASMRRLFWFFIQHDLQKGVLIARGFEYSAKAAEWIGPEFFNNAIPDYDEDSVTSHGRVYYGVRIFRANLLSRAPDDRGLPHSAPVTKELRVWYVQRYKDWPKGHSPPGKERDWEDAKAHWKGRSHHPTRAAVYAMREEIAKHWSTTIGRPKNSINEKSPK